MSVFIFITCATCGVLSGIVYDVLYVARCLVCGVHPRAYTAKDRVFLIACDIVYCAVFAAGYVFTSVMFAGRSAVFKKFSRFRCIFR